MFDVMIVVFHERSTERRFVFVWLAVVALSIVMHLLLYNNLCFPQKTLHCDIRIIHLSLLKEERLTVGGVAFVVVIRCSKVGLADVEVRNNVCHDLLVKSSLCDGSKDDKICRVNTPIPWRMGCV